MISIVKDLKGGTYDGRMGQNIETQIIIERMPSV